MCTTLRTFIALIFSFFISVFLYYSHQFVFDFFRIVVPFESALTRRHTSYAHSFSVFLARLFRRTRMNKEVGHSLALSPIDGHTLYIYHWQCICICVPYYSTTAIRGCVHVAWPSSISMTRLTKLSKLLLLFFTYRKTLRSVFYSILLFQFVRLCV